MEESLFKPGNLFKAAGERWLIDLWKN